MRRAFRHTLNQEARAPEEGEHIVRAVGSRGSNIIEVEFPDGRSTLCLLPAKFHKKLWIKKGNYLLVEDVTGGEADARVTGQIVQVLYEDHVKQLKRMPGVWPEEFASGKAAAELCTGICGLRVADEADEQQQQQEQQDADAAASSSGRGAARAAARSEAQAGTADNQQEQRQEQQQEGEEEGYSSEDSLPPIEQINNRRVIEYEVSESDSD